MNSAKNLKEYNATTTYTESRQSKVNITEHLPKEFYLQKKKLMPTFKQARKDGHHTKWIIEQGKYCLLINKDIYYPQIDLWILWCVLRAKLNHKPRKYCNLNHKYQFFV